MSHVLTQAVWYPHTDRPALPVAALIAVPDADVGVLLKPGIFMHSGDDDSAWASESGEPMTEEVFWWMDESELVDALGDLVP